MNDFLTDSNANLIIEDGDFKVGSAHDQNVTAVLKSTKGSFVQFPLIGVGLLDQVNGFIDLETKRKIRLNLQSEGYRVRDVKFTNGKLAIDYAENTNR